MERLTKELLISKLNEIIKISKEAIPGESWSEKNYLYELPRKWELSRIIIKNDKILGYIDSFWLRNLQDFCEKFNSQCEIL